MMWVTPLVIHLRCDLILFGRFALKCYWNTLHLRPDYAKHRDFRVFFYVIQKFQLQLLGFVRTGDWYLEEVFFVNWHPNLATTQMIDPGCRVWQGILTTLSQTGGGYKYDYATIPFLAEVLKVENWNVACNWSFTEKQCVSLHILRNSLVFCAVHHLWLSFMEGKQNIEGCKSYNKLEQHISLPNPIHYLPCAQ